eukprot:1213012-Rhodomonas_salina.1
MLLRRSDSESRDPTLSLRLCSNGSEVGTRTPCAHDRTGPAQPVAPTHNTRTDRHLAQVIVGRLDKLACASQAGQRPPMSVTRTRVEYRATRSAAKSETRHRRL